MKLEDDNINGSKSTSYSITVIVEWKPEEQEPDVEMPEDEESEEDNEN